MVKVAMHDNNIQHNDLQIVQKKKSSKARLSYFRQL